MQCATLFALVQHQTVIGVGNRNYSLIQKGFAGSHPSHDKRKKRTCPIRQIPFLLNYGRAVALTLSNYSAGGVNERAANSASSM